MPCRAVPCRAVPCAALPCRAVPCRAVPCRAVPCAALPCRAVPCRAVPCRAVPCRAVPEESTNGLFTRRGWGLHALLWTMYLYRHDITDVTVIHGQRRCTTVSGMGLSRPPPPRAPKRFDEQRSAGLSHKWTVS